MNPPLKIRSLNARAVVVPMKRPLATSTGAITTAPLLLIDLQTDAGIAGCSYLFGITQQNLRPLAALVELMGEMVRGDPLVPFEIEAKLRKRHTLLGVHNMVLFAMSGIDMAAWDALAQGMQQPLVRLLGGAPRPVRDYNCKGLGIMPLKALAREAEELVDQLHPLQKKFIEHAALHCGICTPGFLVSAKVLLERNPNPTVEAIRYALAGNLCRCTGYDKIVRAVQAAAEELATDAIKAQKSRKPARKKSAA